MILERLDSDFLRYLLARGGEPGSRLPSLNDISDEIGISVGKLREQFEVARTLGLVEASPRRGIRSLKYDFLPAVRLSLMMALALDRNAFRAYSTLRIHLETAFWDEAVSLLTDEDKVSLARPGERCAGPSSVSNGFRFPIRASRVPPDHLQPAGQPVRARPARGLLGCLRGGRVQHLRRLRLSAGGLGLPRAHRRSALRG